jgi:alkanesulfonate monooxygenase SsuD/methylene tetrahydromethanopterin reductase-like flavin-dependent oxidoreductase (luciferase family)
MSERPLRLAAALNGYGLEHPDGRREVLAWDDIAGLARLVEELGFEAVFAPEIGGWEAFTLLTGMATETERVGLVSGVIPLSSRDPLHLAMGAASLQELSGGRLTVGVGSRASIPETRAALLELRELVARGHSSAGAAAQATDWAGDPRPAPIYLAALGPNMTDLAGEVADGVILNWATPERVEEARAAVGLREDFTIAVYVRACLSHVDARSEEALRVTASRYAAMDPYRRQFEAMGIDPSNAGRVVAAVCVRGDRDSARRRFQEYADAGADLVVVYPVAAGEAVSSLRGTLMAAAAGP